MDRPGFHAMVDAMPEKYVRAFAHDLVNVMHDWSDAGDDELNEDCPSCRAMASSIEASTAILKSGTLPPQS